MVLDATKVDYSVVGAPYFNEVEEAINDSFLLTSNKGDVRIIDGVDISQGGALNRRSFSAGRVVYKGLIYETNLVSNLNAGTNTWARYDIELDGSGIPTGNIVGTFGTVAPDILPETIYILNGSNTALFEAEIIYSAQRLVAEDFISLNTIKAMGKVGNEIHETLITETGLQIGRNKQTLGTFETRFRIDDNAVTTGIWNGSTIAVNRGGTGQTSYTNGQLLIGNTSGNTLTKATLNAGSYISITDGPGSINIGTNFSGANLVIGNPGVMYRDIEFVGDSYTYKIGSTGSNIKFVSSEAGTGVISLNFELGSSAILTNAPGTWIAETQKTSIVVSDRLLIEDSADSYKKKYITASLLSYRDRGDIFVDRTTGALLLDGFFRDWDLKTLIPAFPGKSVLVHIRAKLSGGSTGTSYIKFRKNGYNNDNEAALYSDGQWASGDFWVTTDSNGIIEYAGVNNGCTFYVTIVGYTLAYPF